MQWTAQLVCMFALVALTSFASFWGVATYLEVREAKPLHAAVQNLTSGSQAILEITAKQAASLDAENQEFKKTIADIHDFVIHLDLSVNGNGKPKHPGLVPTAARVLDQQNDALLKLEDRATLAAGHLDDAIQQANALLQTATGATTSLADLIPLVKAALARLDDAMAESNAILAELHGMAQAGNEMAQMLETKLRQLLKPASFAKQVLMFLLQTAPPIATAVR